MGRTQKAKALNCLQVYKSFDLHQTTRSVSHFAMGTFTVKRRNATICYVDVFKFKRYGLRIAVPCWAIFDPGMSESSDEDIAEKKSRWQLCGIELGNLRLEFLGHKSGKIDKIF